MVEPNENDLKELQERAKLEEQELEREGFKRMYPLYYGHIQNEMHMLYKHIQDLEDILNENLDKLERHLNVRRHKESKESRAKRVKRKK